ncbi:MAG: hypothetical protein D6809_04795 [Gammaproteobacteria bacterium]|nr:MAG: hypothetical protein D6809_04795 [Gammaproteobacteria bacterium]
MSLGRRLASLKLTLAGMLLLALGVGLRYGDPDRVSVWVLVLPMGLLALNLLAAVTTNPRIYRRGGLLAFHLALLGLVVLAAIGRLTLFEGHVELVEGQAFSAAEVFDVRAGPLHDGGLERVRFVQGPWTVQYSAGMVRGPTRSTVLVPDGRGGWERRVVGDDVPLVLRGYRFYTSYNKGFAPILTWIPDGPEGRPGAAYTGAVHMPAYPLYDFRQTNTWRPPGGPELKLWLHVQAGLRGDADWVLDGHRATGRLAVRVAGEGGERRVELRPGEAVHLPGGTLRFERLGTWMGYKIFYDPTLPWLFVTGILGVLGLAAHYWRRFGAGWTTAREGAPQGSGARASA